MKNKRITWDGGSIVVRPATVTDEMNAQIIAANAMGLYANDPTKQGYWAQFGNLCSQTVSSEGLPFKPERVLTLVGLDLQSAYESFMRLPGSIRKKWAETVRLVNADDTVKVEDVEDTPNQPAA